jgi:uncharacterized protein (TIRG00374 family)
LPTENNLYRIPGQKKGIGRIIGLPIAVIPIVWIFWRLDFHRLIACIPKVAWWTIPVMSTFIVLSMTLQGVRWWITLRPLIPGVPFNRVMAYHFIGVFYSIVLPTSASTDVVKTLLLSKQADYSVSWGATWLCRVIGFLALIILSVYGLVTLQHSELPKGFWFALGGAFIVTAAVLSVSFSKRLTSPFRPLLRKIVPAKVAGILENIRQGIYLYRDKRGTLVLLFFVTMVTQIMMILAACFALYGVSGKLFLADYFAFIPIIEVVANSGPTPNGMGTREALTALLFKYLHVSNEQLGIYVFLTLFFTIGLRLLGGLPVFHGMVKNYRRKKAEKSPQQ